MPWRRTIRSSETPPHIRWRTVEPGRDRREVAWDLIRDEVGGSIRLTNPCPRCGGPHGPVQVHGADVRVSVSYAGDLAIIALSGAAAVGVDAELRHDEHRDAAGLGGVLGPASDPSVRDWVRVEAALKADGRGLRVEPAQVVIRLDDTDIAPQRWGASVPGHPRPIIGWDLPGPPGVIVSAAIATGASAAE